jgi:hypothetical protein
MVRGERSPKIHLSLRLFSSRRIMMLILWMLVGRLGEKGQRDVGEVRSINSYDLG